MTQVNDVQEAPPTAAALTEQAQFAGLQEQIKQLTDALTASQRKVQTLIQHQVDDFDAAVSAEVDKKAAKAASLAEDAEQQAKSNYGRPTSYAEYAALSPSEKSELLSLYGSEMVSDLVSRQSRLNAVIRSEEQQRLIAKHNKSFKK